VPTEGNPNFPHDFDKKTKGSLVDYRHRRGGEDWQDESYPVYLDWTTAHLDGKRTWFRCPADGCGQRVAILYGGGIFACRHCYQLTYPSQRNTDYDRMARRADRIRDKLGWEPGCLNGPGAKPKGMHWSTFERLTAPSYPIKQSYGNAERPGANRKD